MEAVSAWGESEKNEEYFYIEEEEVKDGRLLMSVAGRYSFWVHLEHFTVQCSDTRAPVQKWLKEVKAKTYATIEELLDNATAEYKRISDDLDAMDEDDDDDEEEEEDDLPITVEPVADSKQTADRIEKERQFEELLKTLKLGKGNKVSTERILSDYKSICLSTTKCGWDATPLDGDLYNWQIRLFDFEAGSQLHADFRKLKEQRGKDCIEMLLAFPADYPFKPPFLRILRPRFQFQTGRVTLGGSICHELLTNKGWKPVNDIESIIETIRAEITDPEAKARLDLTNTSDYQESDARQAFERTAERYGWN